MFSGMFGGMTFLLGVQVEIQDSDGFVGCSCRGC